MDKNNIEHEFVIAKTTLCSLSVCVFVGYAHSAIFQTILYATEYVHGVHNTTHLMLSFDAIISL